MSLSKRSKEIYDQLWLEKHHLSEEEWEQFMDNLRRGDPNDVVVFTAPTSNTSGQSTILNFELNQLSDGELASLDIPPVSFRFRHVKIHINFPSESKE